MSLAFNIYIVPIFSKYKQNSFNSLSAPTILEEPSEGTSYEMGRSVFRPDIQEQQDLHVSIAARLLQSFP